MSTSTIGKTIKNYLIAAAVIGAIIITAPMWGGFDPFTDREQAFGPRKVGIDKDFGCRYMSLDVELTTVAGQPDAEKSTFRGLLSADLGSAGKIEAQHITIPNFRLNRQYFKQEFCAKPGEPLYANVTIQGQVASLMCYFYWDPDADAGNATSSWFRARTDLLYSHTWCRGVVPA